MNDSLDAETKKRITDFLRTNTDKIPTPMKDIDVSTILCWLNTKKREEKNLSEFFYKDCIFKKIDGIKEPKDFFGNNALWTLSCKSMDNLWIDFLEKYKI